MQLQQYFIYVKLERMNVAKRHSELTCVGLSCLGLLQNCALKFSQKLNDTIQMFLVALRELFRLSARLLEL